MSAADVKAPTRFEKVASILREAARGDAAAYGGLTLWTYSRDRLLESSLEGVRLIALQAPGSCCGTSPGKGGSAESGLIRGLRGLSPFDGSQFPRLPWGAEPVTEEEIRFIADWIDDGAPAESRELASFPVLDVAPQASRATVESIPELEAERRVAVGAAKSGEYQYQPGELKQRMNIDCMAPSQLEKLRYAFRQLYELNKWPEDSRNYNNLALVHQNHCQHGWERFLPWHRIYLYEFEQALQDQCPGVTMPYWDWTMPQYKPERPQDGKRIPRALQAFLTQDSLKFLAEHRIPTEPLQDMAGPEHSFYSPSQFFKAVCERIGEEYTKGVHRNRFIDALLDANSLWYPLRYPGEYKLNGEVSTINKTIHYHYPSPDDIRQLLSLRTFRDFGGGSLYNDSFGFLDQNPHNTLHIWTGGMNPDPEKQKDLPEDRNKGVQVAGRKFHKREDLYTRPPLGDMFSNLTAAYDPVFWPVHANVDRLWWEWQQDHPNANPDDLDAVLTPWSYTIRDTLEMYRFGYEYVRASHTIAVGMGTPVGRFVSPAIDVGENVRNHFQRAEVRLHRVPQLPRSCFIRIFINLPDADANTGLDHDGYAGYLAVFGHGECYGGPGHCDIPPPQRRPYDRRPRDHNTPRNHRIDVTKCVRKAFENGATSLQLTLVVIGVDYEEDPGLLRLEGVSLNFLD